MRKLLIIVAFAVAVIGISAYLYYEGKEYVFRIPEAELQAKLASKLPITKTHLFILQTTLSNPRVHLEDRTSRVNAGLDVLFNIKISNNPKLLGGTLDVSGGVVYTKETGQFYLSGPTVDRLEVQGIPAEYKLRIERALEHALDWYFASYPIYKLSRLDAKEAAARLVLKSVTIEDKQLVLVLGL